VAVGSWLQSRIYQALHQHRNRIVLLPELVVFEPWCNKRRGEHRVDDEIVVTVETQISRDYQLIKSATKVINQKSGVFLSE
jgi:hypothetical protein